MTYEKLQREAEKHAIEIYEKSIGPKIKGFYADQVIWINQSLPTNTERACILAEELGHYHTTAGDILDQKHLHNRKQEQRARGWAYIKLVSLHGIVQGYKAGVRNRYELAEFLDVTELFLGESIRYYQMKYGLYVEYEHYTIRLDPLGIIEKYE